MSALIVLSPILVLLAVEVVALIVAWFERGR